MPTPLRCRCVPAVLSLPSHLCRLSVGAPRSLAAPRPLRPIGRGFFRFEFCAHPRPRLSALSLPFLPLVHGGASSFPLPNVAPRAPPCFPRWGCKGGPAGSAMAHAVPARRAPAPRPHTRVSRQRRRSLRRCSCPCCVEHGVKRSSSWFLPLSPVQCFIRFVRTEESSETHAMTVV